MPTKKGSFKIFTFAGITVYVHWMWILVAIYSIQYRTHIYYSLARNAAEYLSLFLIVLIHEFGHQLACRSVGGKTHDIVLWFLGGVAYVSPPQRPGAQLWSIAAGPLVNVVLIPILSVLVSLSSSLHWYDSSPDLYNLIHNIWWINIILLVFNMMPVYPLDGGQILRSLLWFLFGRANSLLIASVVGFIGVAVLVLFALVARSVWLGIMAAFILMSCWSGLTQARQLAKVAKAPRRDGFRCPSCRTPPPVGPFWRCGKCRQAFDTFATHGLCPHCNTEYAATSCPECGTMRPIIEWEHYGQMPPTVDV
ncbi:MAG TPA: site-2 protease family protein [Verrucomicrobiae bacterium]|nr:site-2 protease family protein [Verrucomicrobiae bacterium]